MANSYDFSVAGGETKSVRLTWSVQTGVDGGGNPITEPYDLTGCTARMQFRRNAGETVLAELNDADGSILIEPGGEAGVIQFTLDPTQTLNFYQTGTRRVKHDLFVEFPDGSVKRVIHGQVSVDRPITILD